ncbi:MAG: hypothetical protein KAJ16_07460 [Calditrichia bacterium]|nr:hypothetical protein [Calditrichia bacterium]
MSALRLRPIALGIFSLVCVIMIVLIETVFNSTSDGTFLLTLTFWVALIQGPVALVAAAEVSKGKWIQPLKRELLVFYPLNLVLAILFIFMLFKIDIYPWAQVDHRWLNPNFFIARNSIMLLISFIFAHLYVRASLQEKSYAGKLGILYLFTFIATQSLVAFDWVMSLAYPWMSTMFAPIFFMESFYAGLAVAGIIAAILLGKKSEDQQDLQKVLQDSAVFMFGFALAWAGLYYGQFLVIWYGNIPWETSYFSVRMDHSPYGEMMYLIIILLFIVPFVVLLPKKIKNSRMWVSGIAILVILGLLIERIFYIAPATPINFFWFLIEFLLFGLLMVLFFINRDKIIKTSVS